MGNPKQESENNQETITKQKANLKSQNYKLKVKDAALPRYSFALFSMTRGRIASFLAMTFGRCNAFVTISLNHFMTFK